MVSDVRRADTVNNSMEVDEKCSSRARADPFGGSGSLTVSTNTEVDFLVERIGLVGFGDTKNGVLKKLRKSHCQESYGFDGAN